MYFPGFPRFSPFSLVLISFAAAGADLPPHETNPVERATALAMDGRLDEAANLLETNRALAEAAKNDADQAAILNMLGLIYVRQQKYFPAQNAFDNSIALLTRAKGENDPAILGPLNNEAQLYYEAGQYAQAESLLRKNLALRSTLGANGPSTATQMGILGKVYLGERKYFEAKQSAEDSLALLEKEHQADGLSAALAYSVLGAVYCQWQEAQGAQQSLERSLALLEKSLKPNDYRIGEGIANLGLLYAEEGVTEKAEPLLEKAHGFFLSNSLNTLFTREFLTRWSEIERKRGHKKKARELIKEAAAQAAVSPQATLSRYVVDARSYR